MIYIGLAGHAGAGKDTVADYLAERYGFIKCAFSDALYDEVQTAFGLEDQTLLRDRETKELPLGCLALARCADLNFCEIARTELSKRYPDEFRALESVPLSPRQVLQWWGTEYRREQDPNYWLDAAKSYVWRIHASVRYPEQRPQLFVNTACRFPNEQAFVHHMGDGNVWHIRRPDYGPINSHMSDSGLPVLEGEREIWNGGTIEQLHGAVDLLLSTAAQFVRVEPMAPDTEPPQGVTYVHARCQ